MQFVCGGAIELKVTGQHFDVIACGGDGFACIAGFQLGQLFFMVQNFLGNLDQYTAFFSQVHLPPWARQCGASGFHGQVNFMGATTGDFVKNLTVAGVGNWQTTTIFGVDPLIADQHFVHDIPLISMNCLHFRQGLQICELECRQRRVASKASQKFQVAIKFRPCCLISILWPFLSKRPKCAT